MYRQKKKNHVHVIYTRERAPQKHIFSGLKIHLHTCSSLFLILLMVWRYKRQYTDKTLTLRKIYDYASEPASALRKFSHFHILKRQFPSICCWYTSDILCLRNIYFQVSNYICIHIQSMQFPFITYGMALYIYTTLKTLTLRKYVYMRASEASDA